MEKELYHFGIKGMKWGVRRYQNRDGSLTSAGKRRYTTGGQYEEQRRINDRMMEKIRPGFTKKNPLTEFNKKASSQENVHDDYKKAHDRKDVKTMSDAELREVLNRLDMEKRYNSMNPNTLNTGKKYADKVIKAAATVASVTGTALAIYNNLEKLGKIIKKE